MEEDKQFGRLEKLRFGKLCAKCISSCAGTLRFNFVWEFYTYYGCGFVLEKYLKTIVSTRAKCTKFVVDIQRVGTLPGTTRETVGDDRTGNY